tara:strand:+ start:121 stop:339 length:219 start_codon:yes stop_codon:yes gene_type:complete
LVGARVIRNQKIPKEISANVLRKNIADIKEDPNKNNNGNARSAGLEKKESGKSYSKVNPIGKRMRFSAYAMI